MTGAAAWPAVVLAAGFGTRLHPLSAYRAKAALPVAGRPLIVRILEALRMAGVGRVVINLHHRPETITAIVGDGSALGVEVRYSWEPQPLGSAGGPARALPLLGTDRFFIVNGDTLCDVDFAALAETHRHTSAAVTMAVAPGDLRRYNAVLADADGRVTGFAPRGEPDRPDAFHFTGVQAVNASAFAGVSPTRASETVRELYPRLLGRDASSVRVFTKVGAFHDVGTPADYFDAVHQLAAAEGVPLVPGAASRVAQTARVDGSIIWDRVTIGDRAVVTDCIVADEVEVPPGSSYHRQVITRDGVVSL
jgi:NDP-sugar pyrophosphorylase family protein